MLKPPYVRVAVVDDHPQFRKCVRELLSADAGIMVVSEGGSASAALEIARDVPVDLMLLDVSMPGSGLEAARCISRDHPSIRVVMLSSSERLEDIAEALSAGVKAYVIKGIRGHELIELVRSIATTFLMLLTAGM